MRILAALALVIMAATPTAARHADAPPPPLSVTERIDALDAGMSVDISAADFDGELGRSALDVRYGPAGASTPERAVWRMDDQGRDDAMLRRGIGRIVLIREGGIVRISAESPSITIASR